MLAAERQAFNDAFNEERYQALLADLDAEAGLHIDFRISETPIFLSTPVTEKLVRAAHEVVAAVTSPAYLKEAERAVPADLAVPGDEGRPVFLQVDFALVRDEVGEISPRLIEIQGFPSLYGFQWLLDRGYRGHYPSMPAGWTPYYGGLDERTYPERLRQAIVAGAGDVDPENVILLEIAPDEQKTRVDFAVTERLVGIATVGVDQVTVRGRQLFYRKDGREIPIHRIYNRVIFDEASRKGIDLAPIFRRDLDVTWVGHPHWFWKISKFSLPFIDSPFAPPARFVSDLTEIPPDLEHYVLKPLFSFAGLGVEVGVTAERLRALAHPEHYILQRKVDYAPIFATPDGGAKAEVRMMFVASPRSGRLELLTNLVRMSKGAMMGVDFNKNKTWVGASHAYHAPGL